MGSYNNVYEYIRIYIQFIIYFAEYKYEYCNLCNYTITQINIKYVSLYYSFIHKIHFINGAKKLFWIVIIQCGSFSVFFL